MTKEELKNAVFSGVNLDSYRKASMEQFIEATDDLTIDNFMEKYYAWVENNKSKKVYEDVREAKNAVYDAKIKIGINAIASGDYSGRKDADTMTRFGMDVVKCNKTGLSGIITTDGQEVLPCIFEFVNIHLDGYTEAVFKGMECTIMFFNRELVEGCKKLDNIFFYGQTGAYKVNTKGEDPLAQQLYAILSMNHH